MDAALVDRFKLHWDEIIERLVEGSRDRFDVIGHRDIDQRKFAKWTEMQGLVDCTIYVNSVSHEYSVSKRSEVEWSNRRSVQHTPRT